MERRRPGDPVKVLLVGYNGANNTGSEARLLSILEDVRAVLGPQAHITIPTLNQANLRRYVQESDNLAIAPIPSIYFFTLRRLVREHDLILLTEGSCYMDTWGSPLLWAFLLATRWAQVMGKPSIAYAVDSGRLSPTNERRVCRDASKTSLIITRTRGAADRLRSCGVTAPIEVTEDTALNFEVRDEDRGLLRRVWPQAGDKVAGFAVVNFYLWPVVMRPWGRRSEMYRWPYYFSHSPQRSRATEALATGLAAEADRVIEDHDMSVALISMENVDEPLASMVLGRMRHRDRARIFSSSRYNASQMTSLLRSLDLLVTSRYHASVLSLAGDVPQVAVGHDIRLEELYRDLGLGEYFLRSTSPQLWEEVRKRIDRLLDDPSTVKETIRRGYEEGVTRAARNRELLRRFVTDLGWETVG